jgi:SH3 domain-containing YSC84-like protein 1
MKPTAMAAAALLTAALSVYPQIESKAAQAANTQAEAQTFVKKAAITNLFEIDAAHKVESKTSDRAYKDFAQMMIGDHTRMGDELKKQVSGLSGIDVPTSLDQDHQQKLDKLGSESGAQLERDYRQSQIEGHQQAIKLFQEFAESSPGNEDAALKSWAKSSVPTLQKHLQHAEALPNPPPQASAQNSSAAPVTTGNATGGTQHPAQNLVDEAVQIVKNMQNDKRLAEGLKQAKGIYIVPKFGRGAVVVGGRGGVGLLTVRKNGEWSHPAFYDFGAVSLGPQIGGSGGAVAFLLMSQKAVDVFKNRNNFSLNAEAGLSIVTYSASRQISWGKDDIVMWTNTSGAYIGATVSVSDVSWDEDNNRGYYGSNNVDLTKILSGDVSNAGASKLINALPG